MNRILALWSVPRSVSTAFERMMMVRGDHAVLHEPFSAHYYLSEERSSDRFPDRRPEPRHHRSEILARILAKAWRRPVFFKDMAYHVRGFAGRELLARFVNTFIIRHPAEALPSLFHMWPDFTGEETGYAALEELFELSREASGETPAVIDSADLLRDPLGTVRAYCDATGIPFVREALAWEPASPPDWKMWDEWHADAKTSTGFAPPAKKRYLAVDEEPRLAQAYAACLPCYRRLRELRLRPRSAGGRGMV